MSPEPYRTDLGCAVAGAAFVSIPAGNFGMGSAAEDALEDESPLHTVEIEAFECAACPVTQVEYAAFLAATGHEAP
jgi:formylglycine-generating enzyme required for sulfatase activity